MNNRLVSVFSFPNSDPALLNNTEITCVDSLRRSNSDALSMAGKEAWLN